MTSMPTVNDRMVDEFRRTGKRQTSYSTGRSSRLASSSSRVVLQSECNGPSDNGKSCGPRGLGTCRDGLCDYP